MKTEMIGKKLREGERENVRKKKGGMKNVKVKGEK